MDNNDSNIPPSQPDTKRPKFTKSDTSENNDNKNTVSEKLSELRQLMEIKFKFDTVREGLILSKTTKRLPPYLRVDLFFGPALMDHQTKQFVRDEIRQMKMDLIDTSITKLKELCEKCITDIGEEQEQILDTFVNELEQKNKWQERNEFYSLSGVLIEEFNSKIEDYKQSIRKKQEPTKPTFGKKNQPRKM